MMIGKTYTKAEVDFKQRSIDMHRRAQAAEGAIEVALEWLDFYAKDGVAVWPKPVGYYTVMEAKRLLETRKPSALDEALAAAKAEGVRECIAELEDQYFTPDNDIEEAKHDGITACIDAIQALLPTKQKDEV